ncbi:MAG: AMP-binding protein, partial [Clostridia bacterium]|nr:AMP-binding protein [Clostridia bacterium]
STGIAIPGVQIKIDNPNEEGVGEILTKGDNVMLGYYNDEEATARVLRDGWFHTGDLGYMDGADGALYIRGRIKNVIVTPNGKNIYPEELETRLDDKPEIKESLVLAAKSDEAKVKAKIFPDLDYIKELIGHEPSAEEITEAVKAAVADVNAQMPHYKHIDAVDILTRPLERTTTQKVLRYGANVEQ